jgi:Peroxidase
MRVPIWTATQRQWREQAQHRELQTVASPRSLTEAIDVASRLIRQIKIDQPDTNWAAKFVRLNFHDCVGGCDGCVDLQNPSNFGLHIPIDALEPITQIVSQFLTVGDVWALAGVIAANDNQLGTTESFTFDFVGRPMCAGNAVRAGPHREMPKAHFTAQQLVAFFQTNFDFTAQETVAIMGSHSLYVSLRNAPTCTVWFQLQQLFTYTSSRALCSD